MLPIAIKDLTNGKLTDAEIAQLAFGVWAALVVRLTESMKRDEFNGMLSAEGCSLDALWECCGFKNKSSPANSMPFATPAEIQRAAKLAGLTPFPGAIDLGSDDDEPDHETDQPGQANQPGTETDHNDGTPNPIS